MVTKYLNLSYIFSIKTKFKFFLILPLIFITSCAVPEALKPKKVDPSTPVNADERARKNIEEGRGISLKGAVSGRKGTNYEFSTSNPLWRASLETIDFMPLTTVDYSGGIIITDWYSDTGNPNEALKITLRFLSNEIQSNSIKVIVHNKNCSPTENCTISEIESNIKFELQKAILSKAATLEKEAKNKKK
tara:strand:- start:114 stop:683 length:570 start_codon:yes stop_codon:yes gene_type:complete